MKPNNNIDILRYCMSLMIIMIHVGYNLLFPILRLAVPIFFIISSYLFFVRYRNEDRVSYYNKFLTRAIKLYLFWFIILSPITYYLRGWYNMDFLEWGLSFMKCILFNSTFPASWYISAYVIGIGIVYCLQKYIKIITLIGIVLYLYCCMETNYYFLFDGIGVPMLSIYNSFPVGIIFISFGFFISKISRSGGG